jgi:hypothetical protein
LIVESPTWKTAGEKNYPPSTPSFYLSSVHAGLAVGQVPLVINDFPHHLDLQLLCLHFTVKLEAVWNEDFNLKIMAATKLDSGLEMKCN